ncbi:TetR/AcrR family transcriptional regulator [Amycolatopsis pigmentata]|uniref:TetR/AcrR family transcriptional regulator n=1 Tax=Amycolatopsis pigmentata TaxID=450801 RepID=A0ABW5FWW0_9PSEU
MTRQHLPDRRDPRLDRSRSAILSAAVALLSEGGVKQVTVDAVTARSGVARSTLYRHFPNHTELLAAAFQELLPPLRLPDPDLPARERLLRLLLNQADQIDKASTVAAVVWMSTIGLSADLPADADEQTQLAALRSHVIDSYRGPFHAVLMECLPAKLSKRDSEFATAQLIGPLLFNILITGRPNDAEFCARVVDDFLAGHG